MVVRHRLARARREPLGFQITFFRARPRWESDNPSKFTPRQLLLAHAAIADPRRGRLRHDQRAARDALGLAGAATRTTQTWIDDWRLELEGDTYHAKIPARDFTLELALKAPRAPLLQGEGGFSRKGHRPEEASYYYSRPQLAVTRHARRQGRAGHRPGWTTSGRANTSRPRPPAGTGWASTSRAASR